MIYNINEYIEIIDKETHNKIAEGIVKGYKNSYIDMQEDGKCIKYFIDLVSCDEKHYFREESDKFIINKCSYRKTQINEIPTHYIIEKWKNVYHNNKADVYIENGIENLDKEVKDLVFSLNKIESVCTDGSCSGHNKEPLWVNMHFYDFTSILFLTHLICNKFYNEFIITTHPTLNQNDKNTLSLRLQSIDIGEKAYDNAEKLSKYINLIYN